MKFRCSLSGVLLLVFMVAGCGKSTTASSPNSSGADRSPTSATVPSPDRITAEISTAQLPTALSRPVVLPQSGGALVLGGLDGHEHSTSSVLAFDAARGTFAQVGTLAEAAHDAAGAQIGNQFFVFGGGEGRTVDTIQRFATGSPGSVVGHLPQARSDLSAVSTGGVVYVFAGFDGTRMTPAVLATRDGTSFTNIATLPDPVRYAAAIVDPRNANHILIFGGESAGKMVDTIQQVDVAARTATVIGHLGEARGHMSPIAFGNSIFLLGGRSNTGIVSGILRFDASAVTTVNVGELPYRVADAGVVGAGADSYLIGGEGATRLATVVKLHA